MLTAEKLAEMCTASPEILVYSTINSIGRFIFYMTHDMSDGRIPESDWPAIDAEIAVAKDEIKTLVQSLTRFGVTTPLHTDGRATSEYWQWYRWWDGYINVLPESECDLLQTALASDVDLTPWRPQGDWKKGEENGNPTIDSRSSG